MAYQSEIEKLEQRYEENPKQWFAALADAYRKEGHLDLALDYVRGGLEMRPNYASGYIVLGRCLLEKTEHDEAAQAFEQVLAIDAENIIALKSLSEIAELRGDILGARHWLDRLLEVDPMNDEAREALERLSAIEVMPVTETERVGGETTVGEAPEVAVEPGAAWAAEALAAMAPEAEAGEGVSEEPIQPISLEGAAAEAEPLEIEQSAGEEPFRASAEAEGDDLDVILFEHVDRGADLFAPSGESALEITTAAEEVSLDGVSADQMGQEGYQEGPLGGLGEEERMVVFEPEFPSDTEHQDEGIDEEPALSWPAPVDKPLEEELITFEPGPPGGSAGAVMEPEAALEEAAESGVEPEAEDLDVQPYDDGLEWGTGERRSLAISPEDMLEADARHEEVAPPVAFLGDVGGVDAESQQAEEILEESVHPGLTEEARSDEVVGELGTDVVLQQAEAVGEERIEAAGERGFVPHETLEEQSQSDLDGQVSSESEMTEVAGRSTPALADVEGLGGPIPEVGPEEMVVDSGHSDPGEYAGFTGEVGEPVGAGQSGPSTGEGGVAHPLVTPDDAVADEPQADEVGSPEPQPVVTETMAEVYAKQGLYSQARETYQKLLEQRPGDSVLEKRVQELTERARVAAAQSRASRYSTLATGGPSAVTFLQRVFGGESADDIDLNEPPKPPTEAESPAPSPLESAFGGEPVEPPGEPTVPASDEVSLSSVFGGQTPVVPPPPLSSDDALSPPEVGQGVSFDEFYGGSKEEPTVDSSASGWGEEGDEPPEDDFKDWLEGLRT
jgi:tetratricopeptide (TPR) repeat protein